MRFISPLLILLITVTQTIAAPEIVVHKAARKLEVIDGEKTLHTFKIALGFQPKGPKLKQGDGKTPEGIYYICNKNPQSKYHLSLGVSYPGPDDAKRGVAAKLITPAQQTAINAATQRKTIPQWNTKLGGEIFVHGRGSSRDWTLGCIALEDGDIETLFALATVGMKITIKP